MRSLFGRKKEETPPSSPLASDGAAATSEIVQLRVIEARNLKPMDTFGRAGASDPFVQLRLGSRMKKTAVQKGTLEPVWNEEFEFSGVDEDHELVVTVYDWDRFTSNDPMGQVVIPTLEMAGVPDWYPLQKMEGVDEPQGELLLACDAVFPPGSAAALAIKGHQKAQLARKALRERKEREAAAAARGDADESIDIGDQVSPTEAELTAMREEAEAQAAEQTADREEEEARLAEESAAREQAEAEAAAAEADQQEEEARLALERKLQEEADVRAAEERLAAAVIGGDAGEILAAEAALEKEKAEAEEAARESARETAEAAEAKAIADAEMAQANAANDEAKAERAQADSARLTADHERAEANQAHGAAALEVAAAKLAELQAAKLAEAEAAQGSNPNEVGGGYNDMGNRVRRGKKAGGGTRPFSAPLEFTYYCGKAFPGGPLEPVQVQFEAAEEAKKERYTEARDDLLDAARDAAKKRLEAAEAADDPDELLAAETEKANLLEEVVAPEQETVDVGSYTIDVEEAGSGGGGAATDYGEEASEVAIDLSASDIGSIDLIAEEDEAAAGGGGAGGEGKVVAVLGVVGIEEGSEPPGYEVIVDAEAGTISVIRLDYPAEGWEEELQVVVLVDPLKRLDTQERARRREALAWYKDKMAVLRAEAAREWRRQPLGQKTVPGLNGTCGPWDGDQCPSCWRYQQALERDASHTKWRDTSAGRRTLLAERRHRMTGYSAAKMEPRQTPLKVVRARRSRHEERAAFALQRRASRKHPMEELQAVADELLQLSGRVRKRSSDALTGGPEWVWKDRWLQLIELPQGREAVGKPHLFGKPHMRPKPALALEYRHHSNSKRVLGVVPLAGVSSGGYRLILKSGPRGDRMLDLHAAHIPRDSVAYSAFPGFVICGPRDHRTLKRGTPALFMSGSSSHEDLHRARSWHKHLTILTRLGEDPDEASRREQEEIEASEAEKAEADYGDEDAFEEEDEDEEGDDDRSAYSDDDFEAEDEDPAAERARKRAAGPTFWLSATVTEARNLPADSRFDKNDVYISCCLTAHFAEIVAGEVEDDDRRARHRTTTCDNGGDAPTWGGKGGGGAFGERGETLKWTLKDPGATLIVEVWDEDFGLDDDDLIGKAEIPLDPSGEIEAADGADGDWYDLKNPKGKDAGQVRLAVNCVRDAGDAAGVGWEKMHTVRTRIKIGAYTDITNVAAHRDADQARKEAAAAVVKAELTKVKKARDDKQKAIDDALREAAAGTKIDPWGKKDGHASFYQPPPRTYYASAGMVRDARNNAQGAEQHEGGGTATGAHVRYASGELRLMLDEKLESQMAAGADLWNSAGVASSSKEQRINRINRGLVRIPDPYPEDA